MIARLRAYERGHFGLEEAVDEANTAKRHLKIKDRQIEELTQEANNLQVRGFRIAISNLLLVIRNLTSYLGTWALFKRRTMRLQNGSSFGD